MADITLLLALHNHQPVGNFAHVFREGHDRCYRPLLETIAEAPSVKLSLHHTGPLLNWLVSNEPTTIDLLRRLVARGQLEVLGGAFYEPMLAVLPDRDAVGQVAMMSQWCHDHLGVRPRGMWLAERVWEPDLARVLARAGVEYTLLDDTHFRYAGFQKEHLTGHYITEKAGEAVKIFPISKYLRYAIPFHPVEEILDTLRGIASDHASQNQAAPTRLAMTYGDDGEKFGMWPHTYEWVFEKGWLARFFKALTDNQDWLATSQLGEHVDAHPPEGRVYLPTASYEEMMEWSLPSEAIHSYEDFRHGLEERGELESNRPFVRGGMWQGFLSKYRESNAIHKKMIRVSNKLEKARNRGMKEDKLAEATDHLYQAQCNCAYWHGLFGGLYLNWLRSALHEHLIAAETLLEREAHGDSFLTCELIDTDLDGRPEVVISTHDLGLVISPHVGASLAELDLREHSFCPTDVVGRRLEGYHRKIAQAVVQGDESGEQPASIHDMVVAKEAGLERLTLQDRVPRYSFLDDILVDEEPERLLDLLKTEQAGRLVSIADRDFGLLETTETSNSATLLLETQTEEGGGSLTIQKRYDIHSKPWAIKCVNTLRCTQGEIRGGRFATTLNLTLLAADAPDRTIVVGDSQPQIMQAESTGIASKIAIADGWRNLTMELTSGSEFLALLYPVETVTQSEDGFERTYQGTCIVLSWPMNLAEGEETSFDLTLRVVETDN